MFLAPPKQNSIPVSTGDEESLPKRLKDFWLYYWRFDPARWRLFIVQDLLHFSRYSVSYIFVGLGIDVLAGSDATNGVPSSAWLCALAVFLVLSIGEIAHVWTAYIIRRWKPQLREKIRKDFFNYAIGHSHSYFQDNFAGAITRKVTEIAESAYRLHDHLRFSVFGSLISMTAATISLFIISPLYAVGLILYIFSVIAPILMRLNVIINRARRFSEARADVTGSVVDVLTNISSMRNFARGDYERNKHHSASQHEKAADTKRLLALIQIDNLRRLSLVLVASGMFTALIYGWGQGLVSIGDVSAITGISFALAASAWMFGYGVIMTADEIGYIDDAIRMITPEYNILDDNKAFDLSVTNGTLEFKSVDFHFPGQPVFDNLNLKIQAREKIGLMGPSGAGKSTLVSLLLRLFELQGGSIEIDGQNIARVTQDSLRANISVIPQDTSLFHRSLIDNIRYGRLDASDDEVIRAARKACAHDFIKDLPDGYNTMVGERGVKLSGGQRQRIAIARAILKDAPILILDEATSALDSESEKYIQESLTDLMEGKTVIAIAHRLSTIAHLDRLIVMQEGTIVEDGAHSDLIAQKGLYAKLWSMQSGGFLQE